MMRGSGRPHDGDARDRWLTIAWVMGPAAAVLTLAYLVFQPQIGPFAADGSPSAGAMPTATPFPSPNWHAVHAASVTIRAIPFDADGVVNDFSVAGSRLVAAGSKDHAPAAWYSDDKGETWTQAQLEVADPPRARSSVALEWVAAYGSTLAAVGEWQTPGGVPFRGRRLHLGRLRRALDRGPNRRRAAEPDRPRKQ